MLRRVKRPHSQKRGFLVIDRRPALVQVLALRRCADSFSVHKFRRVISCSDARFSCLRKPLNRTCLAIRSFFLVNFTQRLEVLPVNVPEEGIFSTETFALRSPSTGISSKLGKIVSPVTSTPSYGDPVGPLATIVCKPRQGRKAATVVNDSGAGMWLAGLPPSLACFRFS